MGAVMISGYRRVYSSLPHDLVAAYLRQPYKERQAELLLHS